MREIEHVVKPGESFSILAKKYLGDMMQYPRLVEDNNSPTIVQRTGLRIMDPDLIFVGQKIYIPAAGASPRPGAPIPPSARPRPGGRNTKLPTQKIASPNLQFQLDDLRKLVVKGPGWTATFSMSGALQLQQKRCENIVTVNNRGFEFGAKSKSIPIVETLAVKTVKIGYDATTGDVTFENGITMNSKLPYAPSTALSSGMSTSGRPYVKATIKAKDLTGEYKDFVYAVAELKVEIKIEVDPPSARPREPAPAPRLVLSPQGAELLSKVVILTAVLIAVAIFFPPAALAYAAVAAVVVVSVGVAGKIEGGPPVKGI